VTNLLSLEIDQILFYKIFNVFYLIVF
jgi:hypothetical protein